MGSNGSYGTLGILALALLPAAGNALGSAAAEWKRVPPKAVGAVLHAAAGVAIAVVAVELMPRIVDDLRGWVLALAFAAGAAASVLMATVARRAANTLELAKAGPLMVAIAVATDLFTDGIMVGVGSAVSQELGLVLALGQIIANVPGGFATTSNLRTKNTSRVARIGVATATGLACPLGALIGFTVLRDRGAAAQSTALAFVAGLLLLATVEDIVPQGDAPRAGRATTTASFAGGFVVFVLIAQYVG